MQHFSWRIVQAIYHRIDLFLPDKAEVSSLRKISPDQTIALFIGASLPKAVGIGKVRVHTQKSFQLGMESVFMPILATLFDLILAPSSSRGYLHRFQWRWGRPKLTIENVRRNNPDVTPTDWPSSRRWSRPKPDRVHFYFYWHKHCNSLFGSGQPQTEKKRGNGVMKRVISVLTVVALLVAMSAVPAFAVSPSQEQCEAQGGRSTGSRARSRV